MILVFSLTYCRCCFTGGASGGKCRGSIHRVAAADTLWGIARRYNVPVQKILDANRQYDPTVSVGERDGKVLINEGLCIVR